MKFFNHLLVSGWSRCMIVGRRLRVNVQIIRFSLCLIEIQNYFKNNKFLPIFLSESSQPKLGH